MTIYNGTSADDALTGDVTNDSLLGNQGDDSLLGMAGNDTLDGGSGNDWLSGKSGDDAFLFGIGSGNDIINEWNDYTGSGGNDQVVFTGLTKAEVSFAKSDLNGIDLIITILTTGETLTIQQGFYNDTVMNVESFKFTDGTLTLTQVNDLTMVSSADDKKIFGWTSADSLVGATGIDELYGMTGNDTLDGGEGDDRLVGGDGNDSYRFGAGSGNDTISENYNNIGGSSGIDQVLFNGLTKSEVSFAKSNTNGLDLLITVNATGELLTIANAFHPDINWNVESFKFTDTTTPTLSLSQINAATQLSNDDDNTIIGWTSNDALSGAAGADVLYGMTGNDTLDGGIGDDWLAGGDNNDTYQFGIGSGNDTISEGGSFSGGSGVDRVLFTGLNRADVNLAKGKYTVNSSDGTDLLVTILATGETLTIFNAFVPDINWNVETFKFNDATLSLSQVNIITSTGDGDDNTLYGWKISDSLTGGAGIDVLYGMSGNDTLNGGSGYDSLDGGEGNDTYLYGVGSGYDIIAEAQFGIGGSGGIDQVRFTGLKLADVSLTKSTTNGVDLLVTLTDTNELLTISNAFDANTYWNIESFEFTDVTLSLAQVHALTVAGDDGDNTLIGWTGYDSLIGGTGIDLLYGMAGNDRLDGGSGDDSLNGGDGNDTYIFGGGYSNDVIAEVYYGLGSAGGSDQVLFTGLTHTEVDFSRLNDDLIATIAATNETLTIFKGFDSYAPYNVESFEFTDATLTLAQVTALLADHKPTGMVGMTGLASQGQVLTASNTLADDDGLGVIGYQWKANGTAIPGAIATTYTLTQDEVGKTITVVASYTDLLGTAVSRSSIATPPIANVNDAPTGAVTVTGIAKQGQVLTASNTLADLDGLGTVIYQWQADAVAISGATENTYTLTSAEVGKAITVVASYTDGFNKAESVASASSDKVIPSAVAGFTISPVTTQNTDESGAVATYSIHLNTAPAIGQDVAITFTSSDTSEGVIDNASLIFTSSNYTTPQTLTVRGVDDYLNDGDISYQVTAKIATIDIFYKNLIISPLNLSNADYGSDISVDLYGDQGGSKSDVLVGGNGADILHGLNLADNLSGGIGNDTLWGGYGDDNLFGNESEDWLYGEQERDYLDGGIGNDSLDGGLGADTLIGGPGDDTYYLGYDATDIITDNGLPTDKDTVIMPYQLTSYTLPENIEIGTIAEGTQSSSLSGNSGNNVLTGNAGDNTLSGELGSDSLMGGLGSDQLLGGDGNDTLEGDEGNDSVYGGIGNDTIVGGSGAGNDFYTGGSGIDTVKYSSAITGITVDLEHGTASGNEIGDDTLNSIENVIGGQGGDDLTGQKGNNLIDGFTGDDSLSGGTGKDTLIGGSGNDTYVVDNPGDVVTETSTSANEIDSVRSSISYPLLGVNVENLILTGAAVINGKGNGLANILIGNTAKNQLFGNGGDDTLSGSGGDDTLSGGGGNDVLDGGKGKDNLTGGAGADVFRFTTAPSTSNMDTITDFNKAGDDIIQLENVFFKKLTTTGELKAANFVKAAAAQDFNDFVIYNPTTGALLYDADGNETGAAVQIALLGVEDHPLLTHADFVII